MKLLLGTALTLLVAITPVKGAPIKGQSFALFWAKFETAVANKNKDTIAAMTKFPFEFFGNNLTKADSMKKCDAIFSAKEQRCFRNAKPVKNDDRDSYSVSCGQTIFGFAKGNGGYQFTGMDENG